MIYSRNFLRPRGPAESNRLYGREGGMLPPQDEESGGFPAIRKHSGNKKRVRPVLCLRWVCSAGTGSVTERQRLDDFERAVLPHMNAAYNLARWLTRNDADAEDVVQEACLRAFRYFDGFAGESAKGWLLS